MYCKKAILFCLIFTGLHCFSQQEIVNDGISIIPVKLFGTNYKDYVIIDKDIYAVTNADSLIIFNIESNQVKSVISGVVAVAKTSENTLYSLDKEGTLSETKRFNKTEKIENIKGQFAKILIDYKDNYIVISDKGIYYQKTNFIPLEDNKVYRSKSNKTDDNIKFFEIPDVSFINSKNQMMLTYDYGEFGGHAVFFDLNTKKFLETTPFSTSSESKTIDYYTSQKYYDNLLYTYPNLIKKERNKMSYKFPNGMPLYRGVKGISENNVGELLISQSLMHFTVSGSLILSKESEFPDFNYSENIENVLEYRKLFGGKGGPEMLNEYLGTTAFNSFDNSFYYYSDKGFFKILKTKDVYSKEFFFKPTITWTPGMSHSVGYEMNVKKFEFISSNELIFLTSNNGIGYFDGKAVKYFK